MKAIAIITTYNEADVISTVLEHLYQQGIDFYIIDNESTDRTMEIVSSFEGRGLEDVEVLPRNGEFNWEGLLRRKEELCRTLSADWFISNDADEFRMPELEGERLIDSIARIDGRGYTVINFNEYVFVPTKEHPEHQSDSFTETMCWYYRYEKMPMFRSNTWKKTEEPVDLVEFGGHQAHFPSRRVYPVSLSMRHYLFISMDKFKQKYFNRNPSQGGRDSGWHGWRKNPQALTFELPAEKTLCRYNLKHPLAFDPSRPRDRHIVES